MTVKYEHDTDDLEIISTNDAMELIFQAGFGRPTRMTVITWIHRYRLGFKLGGRWKVNKTNLERFLKGKGTHHDRTSTKTQLRPGH